jgi:aspartate racemase
MSVTVGLIGGISYTSSVVYYTRLNEMVGKAFPGHSAKIVLISLDLNEYAAAWAADDLPRVTALLVDAASKLEVARCDCIAICSNTAHFAAKEVAAAAPNAQLVHIGECIAIQLTQQLQTPQQMQKKKIGFLSTKYSARSAHIAAMLESRGFEVLMPDVEEQEALHGIIERELSHNVITPASRLMFVSASVRLWREHAVSAIVLGCTEIGLLLRSSDLPPGAPLVIDSLEAHCEVLGDIVCKRRNLGSLTWSYRSLDVRASH